MRQKKEQLIITFSTTTEAMRMEKFCLEQAMERNSMTTKEMQKYIEKTDKYRGDFYKYYTGHEWTDARNYHLCLDSGKLGFQKCVEEIKAYMKIRFDQE